MRKQTSIDYRRKRPHRYVSSGLDNGTFIKMARISVGQYLIRFYKQTHSDERSTYMCNEFTSRPGAIASFMHSRERALVPSSALVLPSSAKRS